MTNKEDPRWDAVEEASELLQEGEVQRAIAALQSVVDTDPANPYAHHFLGHGYFEQEDFSRALAGYVRALELAPGYPGAMIGAGQSLRMMGEFERAIRMGKEVLRVRKDDADALYLLGAVYFQRGENKLAHGFLQRFLETDPDIEVAMEVEGMMQVIRGEVLPFPGAQPAEDN